MIKNGKGKSKAIAIKMTLSIQHKQPTTFYKNARKCFNLAFLSTSTSFPNLNTDQKQAINLE